MSSSVEKSVVKGAGYTLFVLFLINFLNFFDREPPRLKEFPGGTQTH